MNDRRAVVLGGSIAGLMAARILADHFSQVLVVERDALPQGAAGRRGVPQGRHVHGLLGGGRDLLEAYLPGITRDMEARGALVGDSVLDCGWHLSGGYLMRFPSTAIGVAASRPLIESTVRDRVLQLPNVVVRQGVDALGLVAGEDGTRVLGVRLLDRRPGSAEEQVPADLVVDATGRGSRAPEWLEAFGFDRPQEDEVRVDVTYTTRRFRRGEGDLDGARMEMCSAEPGRPIGGFAMAQEGGTWLVTLIGYHGTTPPADLDGFRAAASALPARGLSVVVANEPIEDAVVSRFPASRRRRWERVPRLPAGFVPLGDAIASFNPVYGQGMTAAVQEAAALDRTLREGRDDRLPERFLARAARVVDIPWSMAAGSDFRFAETVGRSAPGTALVNRYTRRLQRAARHDRVVAGAFFSVMNLRSSPAALLRPDIAVRVLVGGGRRADRPQPTGWARTPAPATA